MSCHCCADLIATVPLSFLVLQYVVKHGGLKAAARALAVHGSSDTIARMVCLMAFTCLVVNGTATVEDWEGAVQCGLLHHLGVALDHFPDQPQICQFVPMLLKLSTTKVEVEESDVISM